jgi:uncharacterized protein (DUF983 family)
MNATGKQKRVIMPGRFRAILRLRCPQCRVGQVFHGVVAMNRQCPVCGLWFEREPGYFVGSMYISYAFAVLIIALLMFIVSLIAPDLPFHWAFIIAAVAFLPSVPIIVRYSRVIWMHIDRAIDPDTESTTSSSVTPGTINGLPRRNGHPKAK